MTFTNGVAGLVVMSGLITIAEKAHIHFFDRTPDSHIVMFERFDIMSQKVPLAWNLVYIHYGRTAADEYRTHTDIHLCQGGGQLL